MRWAKDMTGAEAPPPPKATRHERVARRFAFRNRKTGTESLSHGDGSHDSPPRDMQYAKKQVSHENRPHGSLCLVYSTTISWVERVNTSKPSSVTTPKSSKRMPKRPGR